MEINSIKKIFPIFNKINWQRVEKNEGKEEEKNNQENEIQILLREDILEEKKQEKKIRSNYSEGPKKEKMESAFKHGKENPDQSNLSIVRIFGVDRTALTKRLSGELQLDAKVGKVSLLTKEEKKNLY